MIALIGYIATIVAANWALQTFGVIPIGFGLLAPAGVLFAGLAFTLRDLVQVQAVLNCLSIVADDMDTRS